MSFLFSFRPLSYPKRNWNTIYKKRQNVNFYSVHTKKTRVQICYALGSDSLNMSVFYIIFCTRSINSATAPSMHSDRTISQQSFTSWGAFFTQAESPAAFSAPISLKKSPINAASSAVPPRYLQARLSASPLSGCFVHNLHQSILRMLDSDAIRLMTSDKFCAFYSILRRYA